MSDYLTTLARRALSPPRSIWPRPAAHFESPIALDRPLGEPSPAPAATRVGPGSPERSVAGRSTRVAESGEVGEPVDTTLRIPSQKPKVSRQGQQGEEPNILRRAQVDDSEEGAPRHSRAVDLDRPSDDAGPAPEGVDLRAISTPSPEAEPELAIERTMPSERRSEDHAGPRVITELDDPFVDGNEDPVSRPATSASTPSPRSMSRSPRRRSRAERDGGPHITVTIGRVEVTSPDRQPPPADQGIQRPAVGLDDYLKERDRS